MFRVTALPLHVDDEYVATRVRPRVQVHARDKVIVSRNRRRGRSDCVGDCPSLSESACLLRLPAVHCTSVVRLARPPGLHFRLSTSGVSRSTAMTRGTLATAARGDAAWPTCAFGHGKDARDATW